LLNVHDPFEVHDRGRSHRPSGLAVAATWSNPSHREQGHHEALSRFLCDAMVAEFGPNFSTYDLKDKIGMSQGTAWKLLSDIPNEFKEVTLQNVAKAFDLDIRDVRVMAGQPAGELKPFTLPMEANQLNHRERVLVCEVVMTLLAARGRRMTR
jgi:hypothetical protein